MPQQTEKSGIVNQSKKQSVVETCLGGREDDLMDGLLVADLNGSDLQAL